jgi:hypothetical protein
MWSSAKIVLALSSAAASALFALSASLPACTIAEVPKDDGLCTARGKCVNDPPPSSDDVATCNQALNGPCGAPYRARLDCVARNQTCTADGQTDRAAVLAACQREETAYENCVPVPPDASLVDH